MNFFWKKSAVNFLRILRKGAGEIHGIWGFSFVKGEKFSEFFKAKMLGEI